MDKETTIVIGLLESTKDNFRKARENYNKKNPYDKTTYAKVVLPAILKFIEANK